MGTQKHVKLTTLSSSGFHSVVSTSLHLPELGAASHQAEQKGPTAASAHQVNPELDTALNGKHLHTPRAAKGEDCSPKGAQVVLLHCRVERSVKPLKGNLTSV